MHIDARVVRHPEFDRIAAELVGQFVDRAFEGETCGGVRKARACAPGGWVSRRMFAAVP